MTTRGWVDWVNIILGVWLVASPWLLTAAAGDGPAAWNSWSTGLGIVMLAFRAMREPAVWGDAIGGLLGMWLIASPWALGFASAVPAATNAVIVGSLIIGYAVWGARIDRASGDRMEHDARRTRSV